MNIEDTSIMMLLDQLGHIGKYHAMKKLEALDLKPGQAGILFVLNTEGSLSQKKLAQRMGITPPSMTAAIKKLEGRGYILKETDFYDQRIYKVCLSEKGKECIQDIKNILIEVEELLLLNISGDERMFLKRLLLEMRKNLMDQKEFSGLDMHSVMKKTCPPLDERKRF